MSRNMVLCTNRWQSWHTIVHNVWIFSFTFMTWVNTFNIKRYHFLFRILLHFQLRSSDWQSMKLSDNRTGFSRLSARLTGFSSKWQRAEICVKIYHSVAFSWIFRQCNQLAVWLNVFSVHSVFIKNNCWGEAESSFCTTNQELSLGSTRCQTHSRGLY